MDDSTLKDDVDAHLQDIEAMAAKTLAGLGSTAVSLADFRRAQDELVASFGRLCRTLGVDVSKRRGLL
jgi:hypothetical protein